MLPAATVYLATSFVWGLSFWLMATVFMVYQIEIVGLDPLQLVLVGTALEVSAFICEVPTGVVADTWSRRASVVMGYLITGLAFLVMGAFPNFTALIIASLMWGLGWTFVSGAHQAWLADEIGESNAARYYLRGARVRNYGAFVGILLAVAIGSYELHYPVLVSGVFFVMWGLLLPFLMPETGFKPSESQGYTSMLESLIEGVDVIRSSSTLILLMVVGVVFGTFSEGYDRLAAAHLLRDFPFTEATGVTPVVAFGAMTALGILLSIGVVALAEKKVNTDEARELARALSLSTLFIVGAVLLFALAGHIWVAIAMYVLLQPLRSLIDPLTMAWFNRNIPSTSRATVISMHSQSDALGQMAGGPGVGFIGKEAGVAVAISLSGLLLLPALWLYGRASKSGIRSEP